MESKRRPIRRLTRRSDFIAIKRQGHRFHVNSWLMVNWRPTELTHVRCGWTIPRHVGTSVVRNRLRRWGREYLRHSERVRRLSVDMNVIFKRKDRDFYKALTHEEFDSAFERMVRRVAQSPRPKSKMGRVSSD